PGVGEGGVELGAAHRRVRLPDEHRLVELAAAEEGAELADLLEVEAKQLFVGDRPLEVAVAVGDEAVHRDAHRVDQDRAWHRVRGGIVPHRFLGSYRQCGNCSPSCWSRGGEGRAEWMVAKLVLTDADRYPFSEAELASLPVGIEVVEVPGHSAEAMGAAEADG